MTSDVEKLEWLSVPENSPRSGVSSTVEMPCLDKDDRKVEKTKKDDLFESEESEKPMPCTSYDLFCAERLPDRKSNRTPGVPINVGMTYMHKAEEKEIKY